MRPTTSAQERAAEELRDRTFYRGLAEEIYQRTHARWQQDPAALITGYFYNVVMGVLQETEPPDIQFEDPLMRNVLAEMRTDVPWEIGPVGSPLPSEEELAKVTLSPRKLIEIYEAVRTQRAVDLATRWLTEVHHRQSQHASNSRMELYLGALQALVLRSTGNEAEQASGSKESVAPFNGTALIELLMQPATAAAVDRLVQAAKSSPHSGGDPEFALTMSYILSAAQWAANYRQFVRANGYLDDTLRGFDTSRGDRRQKVSTTPADDYILLALQHTTPSDEQLALAWLQSWYDYEVRNVGKSPIHYLLVSFQKALGLTSETGLDYCFGNLMPAGLHLAFLSPRLPAVLGQLASIAHQVVMPRSAFILLQPSTTASLTVRIMEGVLWVLRLMQSEEEAAPVNPSSTSAS